MKDTRYHNFNVDKKGSGRIDLKIGALTYVHKDTSTDSTILPISVAHIYSSETAAGPIDPINLYGKGFRLNLQQKLTHHDDDETKWKYIDGNGEEHKFKERYYFRNENNEKEYIPGLKTSDIHVKSDGSLFYFPKYNAQINQTWSTIFEGNLGFDFKISEVSRLFDLAAICGRDITGATLQITLATSLTGDEQKIFFVSKDSPTTITIGSWGFEISLSGNTITFTKQNIMPFNEVATFVVKKILLIESREIFAEIKSKSGLTLQTRLKNFHDSDKIETRHDELIQVQEEIKNIEKSINEIKYVYHDLDNKEINLRDSILEKLKDSMLASQEDTMESFVNTKLIKKIDHDWAYSFQSILFTPAEQQEFLKILKDKYQDLVKKTDGSVHRIYLKTASENINLDNYTTSANYGCDITNGFTYDDPDGRMLESASAKVNEKATDAPLAPAAFQTRFMEKCDRIKQRIDDLIKSIEERRYEELQRFANIDLESLEKQLNTKKYTRDMLIIQLPVNYVIDEANTVLGFNEKGNLVSIFDGYDNQVAIMYVEDRIAKVVDPNGNEITFLYGASGQLREIIDFQNRSTKYYYKNDDDDTAFLETIEYCNGEKTEFQYGIGGHGHGKLIKIIPEGLGIGFSYDSGKMIIIKEITFDGQPIDKFYVACGDSAQVVNIETNENKAFVFFKNGGLEDAIRECYTSNREKYWITTRQTDDYRVRMEHKITLGANMSQIEDDNLDWIRNPEKLFNVDWQNYVHGKVTWVYSKLEDNKVREEFFSDQVFGSATIRTRKKYLYNVDDQLIREEVFETKNGGAEILAATNAYEYNKQGKPIRTISKRGEKDAGTVNEVIYDQKGNITKQTTYHKSNPAAKFYSESVRAENGQVMAELDERGEDKTTFKYRDQTNVVTAILDPDGNETAFGLDPHTDDVLSISASDENGERNSTEYTYEKGLLKKLTCGSTEFKYAHDNRGRRTEIKIDGKSYAEYGYPTDKKTTAKYPIGTGFEIFETVTDNIGNVKTVTRNNAPVITNILVDEKVKSTIDHLTNETTYFDYSEITGDIVKTENDSIKVETDVIDEKSVQTKITLKSLKDVDVIQNYHHETNIKGELEKISFQYKELESIKHDEQGRVIAVCKPTENQHIHYFQKGDHATNLVSSVFHAPKYSPRAGIIPTDRTSYRYDNRGNISEIFENGKTIAKYEYDALNRLTNDNGTKIEYDHNGNILRKIFADGTEFAYTYDGDRLTSFNGQNICYGSNALYGNPTAYRGKGLTWDFRNLKAFGDVGFDYNASGVRIGKTCGEDTTEYFWNGSQLLAEKCHISVNDIELGDYIFDEESHINKSVVTIQYVYGSDGVTGFIVEHDGQMKNYYYRKNVMGDITHILDEGGKIVGKYEYDAWGSHKIVRSIGGIAELNPFRYRGYYYDVETGLYYLKSRYYDPEVGRFINMDSLDHLHPERQVNAMNLFSYCMNNPIMYTDPTGQCIFCKIWNGITGFVNSVVDSVVYLVDQLLVKPLGTIFGMLEDFIREPFQTFWNAPNYFADMLPFGLGKYVKSAFSSLGNRLWNDILPKFDNLSGGLSLAMLGRVPVIGMAALVLSFGVWVKRVLEWLEKDLPKSPYIPPKSGEKARFIFNF